MLVHIKGECTQSQEMKDKMQLTIRVALSRVPGLRVDSGAIIFSFSQPFPSEIASAGWERKVSIMVIADSYPGLEEIDWRERDTIAAVVGEAMVGINKDWLLALKVRCAKSCLDRPCTG